MVLQTTLLLRDVRLPEPLEHYGELIRTMAARPEVWFIVAQADNHMRQEEFPRIRRRMDTRDSELGKTSKEKRPWDAVFRTAVNLGEPDTHAFWQAEVYNRVTDWDISSIRRSLGPGSSAGPGPGPGPGPGLGKKRKPAPQGDKDHKRPKAASYANPGADVCMNYNRGKCASPCRHGRLHKCSVCGGAHPATACSPQPDKAVLAIVDKDKHQ